MKIIRRAFAFALLLAAPLLLVSAMGKAKPVSAKRFRAFVGNYTTKTESRGIYRFDFDSETGKMSGLAVAGESKDPSWVLLHPSGKFLYAANEHGKDSTISAFSVDAASGNLTPLNELPALGADPCHLAFDRTGKFLLTANYTSGNVAVFPLQPDGRLGEHTAVVTDQGQVGPNSKRQDGPHAHWIGTSPDNRFVYVADLGLDAVIVYRFDDTRGTLTATGSTAAKPGSGPRHIAWSRDAQFMYVLGELSSDVSVFANVHGTFQSLQTVYALPGKPADHPGRNDAAEIALHPSGKFLYSSNRGHDSIAVFAVDGKSGKLTYVEDVLTGGKEPRNFAIDPTGKFLLAENQNSNTIVEFRINQATGKLTPTGETLNTISPICLVFQPLD